ncbi:MAG: beta-ketoacyl-ACP synthase II [Bacteroidales bacterium]|nr:beta-ketoacyl-ACP synthase II [Bacteroidales bacterium]MCF8336883.1 beta-ketoacyl-ACP synthase II [Bacteroidales bacterium]
MSLKRVVVTGLGAITPLGNNVPDTWKAMLNGVSGSAEITSFDTSKYKTKFACEVKNFNVKDYLDRKEARKLDPYAQYGIISADEAIRDANLNLDSLDKDRAGVIWASGIGGLDTFTDEVGKFVTGDGTPRFSPFFIPKMIVDIAAGHISIKHGLRGPNYATVSACASSAHSLADAFNLIRLGKTDVFVTGGSEAAITSAGVGGFNAMHAISTKNDDPKTASRPFDKERDGFVLGEGGGAVIFEELNHALERGAPIYAEVVGTGMTGDAHHMTSPHPEGEGARKSMKMAMDEAGINPEEIDHINTHGTSTPLGDVAEIKAIKKLFDDHAFNININSTKSMTGHLLGAAGSVEAIATILAVKHDQVPPTINHSTDDPEIDNNLNLSFGEKAISRKTNFALSNTFGFGGHNATLAFKKYTE